MKKFHLRIQEDAFSVAEETARFYESLDDSGGVVSFIGRVRRKSKGKILDALFLEHYKGMCEKELEHMGRTCMERFPLEALTILHRYGRLGAGEVITIILAAAEHRKAAFEAAESLVDFLKIRAPFWKREESAEGSLWVEPQEEDRLAAERWDMKEREEKEEREDKEEEKRP